MTADPDSTGRPAVARENPFSTRSIRPGRITPLDSSGAPLPIKVLAELACGSRISAIVGPHGSGKSNLLAAVAAELIRHVPVQTARVRTAGDVLRIVRDLFRGQAARIVCIDGWERAGCAGRWAIRFASRWRRSGLLVTAHRARGLPVLITCVTTPVLLERIVAALPSHGGLIVADDVLDAFARHAGNLREALLDLYDRFEARGRGEPAAGPSVTAMTRVTIVPSAGERFTNR